MSWLKSVWAPIAAIGLAALAIFAAIRAANSKAVAEKWRDKAVQIEEGNVVKGIETAEAASSQAAVHDNIAEERAKIASERITKIGEKNEAIADILDNWRKS